MFQGEPKGETIKSEKNVIYVEILLQSSRFSFTIHPLRKINNARTIPKRITLGQTSIRSVCEEMGSLEKRII